MSRTRRWAITAGLASAGAIVALIFDVVLSDAYYSAVVNPTFPSSLNQLPAGYSFSGSAPIPPHLGPSYPPYLFVAGALAVLGSLMAVVAAIALYRLFRGGVMPAIVAIAVGPIAVWLLEIGNNLFGFTQDSSTARSGTLLGTHPSELVGLTLVFLLPPICAYIALTILTQRESARSSRD